LFNESSTVLVSCRVHLSGRSRGPARLCACRGKKWTRPRAGARIRARPRPHAPGRRSLMNPTYEIRDPSSVYSPSLVFYRELIARNLPTAVSMVGDPRRLRPHVKTHKTREIVRMELAAGVVKHKCATLAEAEMVADCGAPDVLVAYPLVGPNCGRMARLAAAFPGCRFSVLTDHPLALQA